MTISIVVPVYNAQTRLAACVDSLLGQTYKDIEILLIDDGSSDDSVRICDEYAACNEQIKVYHKTNGGVSSARNYGIEQVVGQYIMFVDSDDVVDPTLCEKLYQKVVNTGCKTSLCGFEREFFVGNELKRSIICLPDCSDILSGEQIKKNYGSLYEKTLLSAVWATLYDLDIIRSNMLKFDTSLYIGEDMLFKQSYLAVDSRIAVVNEPLYHYYCDEKASLTRRIDPQKTIFAKRIFDESVAFMEQLHICDETFTSVSKMHLKHCFILIESIFSKDSALADISKKDYVKDVVFCEQTQSALTCKNDGDKELLIYKLVLKTKCLWIIKLFTFMRLKLKKKLRG